MEERPEDGLRFTFSVAMHGRIKLNVDCSRISSQKVDAIPFSINYALLSLMAAIPFAFNLYGVPMYGLLKGLSEPVACLTIVANLIPGGVETEEAVRLLVLNGFEEVPGK